MIGRATQLYSDSCTQESETWHRAVEMESSDSAEDFPAYSYVPGGPWPHPNRTPGRHPSGTTAVGKDSSEAEKSVRFLRGVKLFNAGYYWEAHEVWEELWHAAGRRGPTADVLRALIKLAAAGIKVREGRENGVRTHTRRAALLFDSAAEEGGDYQLGLNLQLWARRSRDLAQNPPRDPGPSDAPVSRVFAYQIELDQPKPVAESCPGADSHPVC